VGLCYGATAVLRAIAAGLQGAGRLFWLLWAVATAGLLREAWLLRRPELPRSAYGLHFRHQVLLGSLLLLGLVLGRTGGGLPG
jgi:4-hydroxybenzoate polyprenyltransferase